MEVNKLLISDIKTIITQSRSRVYSSINFLMVETYWNIGRMIVEEEQGGSRKAEYSKSLLKKLSTELVKEFGSGFSEYLC